MDNEVDDPYAGRRISGSEIDVFEPFGPMYCGSETRVYYQKPVAHHVDVHLDRGWLVLCLGGCRSTAAIGSDRMGVAESFGPSITYMPPDCDVRVCEDNARTSDIVLVAPPVQSFEAAADLRNIKPGTMSYFWREGAAIGKLTRSLRDMLLINEFHRFDPLEIETCVEYVVAFLTELYAGEIGKTRRKANFGLTTRQLRNVADFVDANLENTVTLQALAEQAGLSQHHFARQFRRATGTSAYHYVLTKRILKAMALLADTETLLSEIALACGFYDHAHMSNHFAKHVSVRPARYRQIIRT
ncbi:MAG: AraC family transcriptional regulator [Pseudomonadota bacterium]